MALYQWVEFEKDMLEGEEDAQIEAATENLASCWPRLSKEFRNAIGHAIDDFYACDEQTYRVREEIRSFKHFNNIASMPEKDLVKTVNGHKALISALQDGYHAMRRLVDLLRREERITGPTPGRVHLEEHQSTLRSNLFDTNTVLQPFLAELHKRRTVQLPGTRKEYAFSDSWVGTWLLGAGSFGKATLWVRQDKHGKVIDRVVVKDSFFEDNPWAWDDKESYMWTRGDEDELITPMMPTEIAAHYLLQERLGAKSVMIRNWRIRETRKMHRMYLELCPYGDAFDVMRNTLREREHNPRACVPEPFIWSVFEALAQASDTMDNEFVGRFNGSNWTLICHRDTKLSNVFLGMPLSDRYRGYPAPKLADFGLSCLVRRDDDRPANYFGCVGTRCNRPPEMLVPAFPDSSCNIWGVGNVIWSLMELDEGDPNLRYEADPDENLGSPEFVDEPTFSQGTEGRYSSALCNLVRECVSSDPSKRPTAIDLLERIRLSFTSNLRMAKEDDPRFKNEFRVL